MNGRAPRRAPPLRVACLGAGYFARFHHEAWGRIDEVQVVGVADLDPVRATASGLPAFTDLETLLERTRPDLLDIATPPPTHLDAIERALAAGVGTIVCQKPFCGSLEAARRAVARADEAGARLVVHENIRFQPWYRRMRAVIDTGELGDVQQMTFRLRTGDGQGPDAYLDRQPYFQTMPRLLVHETAVHWIDTFRYLLGPIEAVYADLRHLNPAVVGEDAGHVLFDVAGGVRALFDGNRHLDHAAENHRLTLGEALLEGTRGTLNLSGDGALERRAFGSLETERLLEPQAWPGFAGDCVHALQRHVVDAMLHDGPVENAAADYLRVLEIEEAIYRSAERRRKVDV